MRKTMTVGLRLTLVLVILLTSILLTDFSGATPVGAAGPCGWSAEPGWAEFAVQVDFNFSGSGDWVDVLLTVEGASYYDEQTIRVTRLYGEDYGVNAWGFDVDPDQDVTISATYEGSSSQSVASVTEASHCPEGESWTDDDITNGDAWALYVFDADD